jgi:tRNA(fMet)-specific endonuclease VapC
MTGYTLDTNIVTAHLKRNPLVRQRIRQAVVTGHPVMLNAVSYYETKRGLLFAGAQVQLAIFEQLWQAQGIVMFDHAALDRAAKIYADLRAVGQLIEDADLLMAAIALVNDVVLVTHNTAHLSRVADLQLEDWLLP